MSSGISYEEYLEKNGSLTYTNVGVSMLPLLHQGRDLFTVRKKETQRCSVGDVVLYRRGTHYILHRVMEVRNADYVMLGDNCITKEYGITDADIIGVMTSFVRNGKEYSIQDWKYRTYTYVWLHTSWLRVFLKRCTIKLSHFFGKGPKADKGMKA